MSAESAHYLVLWAIMADDRLSAPAKCVAVVLLLKYRNHKTGQCNPSYGSLAKQVGRERRSVIDALSQLRALGWIDWTGTKGGSPSNTNNFQFFLRPQPVQTSAPVQEMTPVQTLAQTDADFRSPPVQESAPEPSKNHLEPRAHEKGLKVKTDTPLADQYRRWWSATGQREPAYSQRTGYYLELFLPLPLEWRSAA
jgi:DNA-binding transcriptional MocR family regulator